MNASDLQNRNTKFSCLRGLDLQELLSEIENFFLIYRDKLNLDPKLIFGLEIEWEGNNVLIIRDYLKENASKWIYDTDGSLNSGGEIKSPRLTDNPKTWIDLKGVCSCLKDINAYIDEKAGAHIHFGANIFGENLDAFLTFLKAYAVFENIFFCFYYGEFLRHRNTKYTWNQKIALDIRDNYKVIKTIEHINSEKIFLRNDRNQSLNFQNLRFGDKSVDKNTIELRIPNGTIEEVIWQNNVNTFAKFILKTISPNFDREYIEKLFLDISEVNINRIFYNEICLRKSLDFVDLIFDNDLDKFYFLRQYFKNFEDNYDLKQNKLAKRFIV